MTIASKPMSFIVSLTGEFGRQNRCFIQRDRVADVLSNMNERRLPMSVISTCKTNTDITAACPMAGADSVICEGGGAVPPVPSSLLFSLPSLLSAV